MADPITYDQMKELLQAQASSIGGYMKGGGGTPGGGGTGSPATGVISGLIEDFGKLRNGASATSTVLTGIAGTLGRVYEPFGAMAGQVKENLMGTVAGLSAAQMQGASFGNNIGEYSKKLEMAGTTPEKFTQMWSQIGPRLNGLGETQGQAANNVLVAMGEFKSKYGDMLTGLGYSNDEQNAYFAKALTDRKFTDLKDSKARQGVIDEIGLNAQKLSEYAATTGKSIADLQKEQLAGEDDVNVTAEILRGGKDTVEAFARVKSGLGDMGPTIKSLTNEMMTGGIRTAEGSAKFAALGPAGAELEKAIMDQKNAKTKEQKDDANAALERAKNRADEYMRSDEFTRNAQNDTSEVGRAQAQMLRENGTRLASTIQAQQALAKEGKSATIDDAKARQQNRTRADMLAVDVTTGKKNPTADAYEAVVKGDAAAQNIAIVKASKETAGAIKLLGDAANTAIGKMAGTYRSPVDINKEISNAGVGGVTRKKDSEIRDTGTLGMTGNLFETKDFYGKVAKGETVLTPDQLTNLVKGSQTSAIPTLFSDMQKNMKMPTGSEKMTGGIPNLKDMFSNVQTRISGIATDAKIKNDAVQKAQSEATRPVAPTANQADDQQVSPNTSGEEPTQKDMLDALNSLNKMMGQLVSLQDTNNNIAEGMTRKISSSDRFTA